MAQHFYSHPFADDVQQRLKLDALEASSHSIRPVLKTVFGLQVLMRVGQWRPMIDECPDCGAKAPEHQPDLLPLRLHKGCSLFCEPGNHVLTIRQLLRHFAKDEKHAAELLMRLGQLGNPSLTRYYTFETKTERVTGDHPNVVQELYVKDGEQVRGIVIECPSIDLAKQLSGQPGSRRKMNFCEDVALREDQTLQDIRWHNAYATPLETRLLRAQQERNAQEHKEKQARELRVFQINQRV
jgi:hypothetical protein